MFYDNDGKEQKNPGFDAVIGNPPWLNAWRMTEEMPEQRNGIHSIFSNEESLSGHWDLFVPFVVQSVELCRTGGQHSFILPNTMLTEKYTVNLRNELLSEHSIRSILSFGERTVFEDVERQCIVQTVECGTKTRTNQSLRQVKNTNPFDFEQVSETTASIWLRAYNHQIRISKEYIDKYYPIIQKLDDRCVALGQYLYVNIGATVSSKNSGDFSKKDVVSKQPTGNAKKFFQGTEVDRYEVNWDNDWLDYRADGMSGPRTSELFENENIVVRKRTNENGILATAHDDSGMYCDDTVIVCCDYDVLEDTDATTEFDGFERLDDGDLDHKYVLSVLNSSLLTWVFKNKFATGALQGSYSDVWPQSVRSFPIIRPDSEENQTERNDIDFQEVYTNYLSEPNDEFVISKLTDSMVPLTSRLLVISCRGSRSRRCRLDSSEMPSNSIFSNGSGPSTMVLCYPTSMAISQLAGCAIPSSMKPTDTHTKLKIQTVTIERESGVITLSVTVKYKPDDPSDFETDGNDYTTVGPILAMEFVDLPDEMAELVEKFVPEAVEKELGKFRKGAGATITPLERFKEYLTLPDLHDISDDFDRYLDRKARADELDEKTEKTDEIIDQIIYQLYGLTDEEIEIVEDAVAD